MENEPENEITITVFRLLVLDLLSLFQVLNQGLISILGSFPPPCQLDTIVGPVLTVGSGHFFEMSKPDADRAMAIYRKFTKQTDYVVQYLTVARQFEHHTRVEVPKLKHAPVTLGKQLDEYLHDPDFETHRRQYLAELDAKKKSGRGGSSGGMLRLKAEKSGSTPSKPAAPSNTNGSQVESRPAQPAKAENDLIDFFGSIEPNQTPTNVQSPVQQTQQTHQFATNTPFQQVQQTGFVGNGLMAQPTGTNPFQQQQQQQQPLQQSYTGYQQNPQHLQPNFTGAGFGGYTAQPNFQPGTLGTIQQDSVSSYSTGPAGQTLDAPQTTNPFRASMMMGQPTGQPSSLSPPPGSNPNRLSTNPFAQQQMAPMHTGAMSPQHQQQPEPLKPAATGTNPFARTSPRPQTSPVGDGSPAALVPQATGTNPFRQSTFVNHNTGMGWQHNQMPMGGGLDQAPTIPVFPRPAQQAPWQ